LYYVVGSASAFAPASGPRTISRVTLASTTVDETEPKLEEAAIPAAPKVELKEAEVEPVIIPAAVEQPAPVEAFRPTINVPDKSRIHAGRYNDKDTSIALPFMKRPPALDGTHAGDYGFDPLGFTEQYDLYTMQESELRHARLAMLAVVGWPLSELIAPDWMLQDGRAPSVLNGFNPLSFFATVAVFGALGYFEFKTSLRRVDDKELGMIHKEDMAEIWKWGVPGDYNFDPLNLYSSIGDDAYARKGLRDLEISHGRSAMLGITGFVAWEALTGHPIVENSMFFHPNALLPALVAGYVAFNQFYELDDSDTFIRFKLSSEGEARMENLKLGMGQPSNQGSGDAIDFAEIAEKATNFVSSLGEKYEQAQKAYLDNVVKIESGEEKK